MKANCNRCAAALVVVAALSSCASYPHHRASDVELTRTKNALSGAWYAGDLHCHSTHSDGDSSVAAVIAHAEERGLDFLALTDHDTNMHGEPSHWYDPAYTSKRLVLLYGVEWTSEKGHANAIAPRPFDYAALWDANRALDPSAALDAARKQEVLFSMNHPICDCCSWEYEFVDPAGKFVADTMEVWNGPFNYPNANKKTVYTLWDELLGRGLRVNAVGGSDNHNLRGLDSHFSLHGSPTTWVFARERTGQAILDAIRQGHVSLAHQPYAGRLELLADADGDGHFEAMMGDSIPSGNPTTFCVGVVGPYRTERGLGRGQRSKCFVYKNGEVFATFTLRANDEELVTFVDTPEPGDYYRAVLRGAPAVGIVQAFILGRTLGLTNPIYVKK